MFGGAARVDLVCVGVRSGRVETSAQGQRGGIAAFSSERDQAEVLYAFTSSKLIQRLGWDYGTCLVAAWILTPCKTLLPTTTSSSAPALPSLKQDQGIRAPSQWLVIQINT